MAVVSDKSAQASEACRPTILLGDKNAQLIIDKYPALTFFCEKLNYTSRLKTSEINFIALSLSSISFGSKVNDKPGIDLTNFDEYELLLEVNPDTS